MNGKDLLDARHVFSCKHKPRLHIALLCTYERADDAEIMLARLEAGVASLRRNRALHDACRERRADSAAGQADRTVNDNNILWLRLEIILLERGSRIRLGARCEAGTHLDAVGAHFYEINDVLTGEDAAGGNDRDLDRGADARNELTHRGARAEMAASLFALYDDCRRTKTLRYLC